MSSFLFLFLVLDIADDLVQARLHFQSVQIGIQFAFCMWIVEHMEG